LRSGCEAGFKLEDEEEDGYGTEDEDDAMAEAIVRARHEGVYCPDSHEFRFHSQGDFE
jgi:hypothetical protein